MTGLLLTRPRDASKRFAAALPDGLRARLDIVLAPLIDIRPVATAFDPGPARGLIFTSVNGVAAAAALTADRGLPCYCVGRVTTATARAAGWQAQTAGVDARALVAALIATPPPAPLVHLRGVHASGDIAGDLTRAGIETRAQAIYDQHLLPLSTEAHRLLDGDDPVIVPLFSPRSARQFAGQVRGRAPLLLAAISPAAAEPLESLTAGALLVAPSPDAAAMAELVGELAERANRVEGGTGPQ